MHQNRRLLAKSDKWMFVIWYIFKNFPFLKEIVFFLSYYNNPQRLLKFNIAEICSIIKGISFTLDMIRKIQTEPEIRRLDFRDLWPFISCARAQLFTCIQEFIFENISWYPITSCIKVIQYLNSEKMSFNEKKNG